MRGRHGDNIALVWKSASRPATGPTIASETGRNTGESLLEPDLSRRDQFEAVRQIVIARSAPRTAIVVAASRSVVLSPSGRKTFPYWKKRIDQRSFGQQ